MYLPPAFHEQRIEALQALICNHPLASVVVHGEDGLNANHLPMVLHGELFEFGALRAHVSRANPLWQSLDAGGQDALAMFHGPQHYISPS